MEASFIDDLGADSLDIVELVMALEEEFDLEIPDADDLPAVDDQIQNQQQDKNAQKRPAMYDPVQLLTKMLHHISLQLTYILLFLSFFLFSKSSSSVSNSYLHTGQEFLSLSQGKRQSQ